VGGLRRSFEKTGIDGELTFYHILLSSYSWDSSAEVL
jgi:hypothetical protein